MHRTYIRENGSLDLGPDARAKGYEPGTLVDVVMTVTGSLIVVPVEDMTDLERAMQDVYRFAPTKRRRTG